MGRGGVPSVRCALCQGRVCHARKGERERERERDRERLDGAQNLWIG